MSLNGQCDYLSGLVPRLTWDVCPEKISSSSFNPSDNPSISAFDLPAQDHLTDYSQCSMPGICTSPPTMSLANVVAELAIRDLVSQFALVTLDPTINFASLWAPDAYWSLTDPFPAEAKGVDEIVELATNIGGGWEFFVQFVHSGQINVKGKTATGRWTIQEVARNDVRNYNNYAVYDDEYKVVNGKWVFSERKYKYIYLDESPIPGESFPVTLDPK